MSVTQKLRTSNLPMLGSVSFFFYSRTHTVLAGSPDKSSVLTVECRATKCGHRGSLEIQITNVKLREMTFAVTSRMNTAAELRASVAQLWINSAHCLLRLNGGN